MQDFNLKLFYSLHALADRTPFGDWTLVFLAQTLPWLAISAAFFYLLLRKDHGVYDPGFVGAGERLRARFAAMIFVFGSVFLTWIINAVLKAAFAAPRPFEALRDAYPLFEHGAMDSFPSGHAAIYAAFAVALFAVDRRAGFIFILVAFLIGFARIAVGVHFPIDIIVGYGVGTIVTLGLFLLVKRGLPARGRFK